MLDWLSDNRALVAAVIILCLVGSFFASIFYGLKQNPASRKGSGFWRSGTDRWWLVLGGLWCINIASCLVLFFMGLSAGIFSASGQ